MALVVDMKMPRNCSGCCLMGSRNCPYRGDGRARREDHPDCPIKGEIPDNHGRLGDLDELEKQVFNDGSYLLVHSAPTVIEASN